MNLTQRELNQLRKLVAACEKILARVERPEVVPQSAKKSTASKPKRTRRSGKELVTFRRMLKAERKRGVPVIELAETHGISTAYIYQL